MTIETAGTSGVSIDLVVDSFVDVVLIIDAPVVMVVNNLTAVVVVIYLRHPLNNKIKWCLNGSKNYLLLNF